MKPHVQKPPGPTGSGQPGAADLGPVSRYFLTNLHGEADLKQGRLLLLASLVLAFGSVATGVATWVMGTTQLTPMLFAGFLFCVAVPVMLRRGWHLRWPTRLLCVASLMVVAGIAPKTGGVLSNSVMLLSIVPLLAAFLVGWHEARAWAVICIAAVITLIATDLLAAEVQHLVPASRRPISHGAVAVVVLVCILLFCRDYVRYRVESGGRLQRAEALRTLVGELPRREASVQNAAEALSANGGLTEDMLKQATTGRQETHEAHAQVDALVGSFEGAADLVGVMLDQARRVDDLVSDAQRVARRLDLLTLSAALEATKTGEASFGLVAEEIGRVASTVNDDLERMREGTLFFQSQLDQLTALYAPSREMAERVRQTMTRSSQSFAALSGLIGDVVVATARLESEAGAHLTAVREVADAAVGPGTSAP